MTNTNIGKLYLIVILSLYSSIALAHSDGGGSGFVSGFFHPIQGLDHVVAMVAVGLWGAILKQPSIWLLPILFPLVMAFGGALGVIGIPIPAVETGIAGSAVVLGCMIAFKLRPPIWLSAVIVGFFAIFHGHAHGSELPEATHAAAYSLGFVIATGLLHLVGIAFGFVTRLPKGILAVQAGGTAIIASGIYFLVQ